MSCRAPALPLDPLIDRWPAGKVIHRIHDTRFEPVHFHPGSDTSGQPCKPSRFAPIRDRLEHLVPHLYGGATLDCALFETVFHDVPVDAPSKFVDLDTFARHGHSQLIPQRELRLIDLTSVGLHRLQVPKEELITSPARDYRATARWAEALHHCCPEADGLVWMSRQHDRDLAVLLFGDRVSPDDLIGSRIGGPLSRNLALRDSVLAAALKAGIEAN
ncbi:MAG: RES family NAD+ phosphorylase [Burkholderiales bacterium]|nr:RES family NAD+ phosphorylase [Burkholderiales bacterium]